jgi:protein-disulfide isomerase
VSQANRNKNAPRPSVQPGKSLTPFFVLVGAIFIVGAAAIAYKVAARPKPIVLPQGIALPKAEGQLLGDPKAPVTIIEFADFECPVCADWAAVTEPDVRSRIVDKGLANMRFYDFPLPEMHPNTLFASLTASCAAEQGKFWEMHDRLMAGQLDWEGRTNKNPKPVFDGYVKQLGLDATKFNACFEARDMTKIEANRQAGLAYQVNGTPSFVIAGKMYQNKMSYDALKAIVDSARVKAGVSDAPAAAPVPAKN